MNGNLFSKAKKNWKGSQGRNIIVRILIFLWWVTLGSVYKISPRMARRFQIVGEMLQKLWAKTPGKFLIIRIIVYPFFIAWRLLNFIYRTGGYKIINRIAPPFLLLISNLLAESRKNIVYPNSVLHISYMVHIPYYMTRILRRYGLKADYLAMGGQSPWWDKYDYRFPKNPDIPSVIDEFFFFWQVMAKYEVIHSHFGIMLSETGWELPVLKKLGRKIVVHYRGCEARDPELNMALHPKTNICQDCDYKRMVCTAGRKRVELSKQYGDEFLVTTPDMQDFMPSAVHFPFFLPEIDYERYKALDTLPTEKPFTIVHVTNHPGIEGTRHIQSAINNLKAKGYDIEFRFLKGVTPEKALEAYQDAHISIGKMKMGYYANAQIESMYLGVPAITDVWNQFMNPELEESGFIFSSIEELESTLEHYIKNPAELAKKRALARPSILKLHSEERLIKKLLDIYGFKEIAFEETTRTPRVLFIGNIANNAYYNAKFLRRSESAEVDVLCYDDYWIMSSPEWEEADFEGDVGHHYYPRWDKVDLKGYHRPSWFAQGTFRTAVQYLTALRQGDAARTKRLWGQLEFERRSAAMAVDQKTKIISFWLRRYRSLKNLISGGIWDRLFKTPPSEDFLNRCKDLLVKFDEHFPNRSDKPAIEELTQYQEKVNELSELFPYYDIVQGYAVDPILPMLVGGKPYIGFEHGTLRDAPEANWDFKGPFYGNSIGRLTALSYSLADHVFITNEDCVKSAERLELKSYSLIPHPLDEMEGFFPTDEFRKGFQAELNTELIFFCPIRHDWVDKGVDRYIRSLPRLREVLGNRFKVVFTPWGREIETSKALIRELDCEDLVAWRGPFGRVKLARWLTSADVIFDQLTYSAFSGLTPRALACGVPVISGYNPAENSLFFTEAAPVLWAEKESDILKLTLKALEKEFQKVYKTQSRAWIEKYHSSTRVVRILGEAYEKILTRI